ncbi:MAG: hypothetical protein NC225_11340 [Clostridium sp.]|nr:hypothetical protein [Clostridium sp.]MCM1459665.1 hypothetical protein [Bacteroides sp.]
MLLKSIRLQLTHILSRKEAIFTWFVLLGFVTWNFISNIMQNQNAVYVTQMYDPVKTLTLSTWSVSGYFMMSFYPLLIVIPTSTVYLNDKKSGELIYLNARYGNKKYMHGKLLGVCIATFLIFTLPFLMEIVLSGICYSTSSVGDPSNFEYIQSVEDVKRYFAYGIFTKNRFLYAVICTLSFGVISAVFAGFNYAVTTFECFKYKIFTFFPIYILFFGIRFSGNAFKCPFTTNYFFILRMFDTNDKNETVYLIFMLMLFVLSFAIIEVNGRRNKL